MLTKISSLIDETSRLSSPVEIRNISMSLIRIVIQHACIALAEGIIASRKKLMTPNINFDQLELRPLRSPADGTLATKLSELFIIAEKDGWTGISYPFLNQNVEKSRPCSKFSKSKPVTPESILLGLISFRNDAELGHGIPGAYDPVAELDAARLISERLANILPTINLDGSLSIELVDRSHYSLALLKTIKGNLICYRKIQTIPNGRCQIKGQIQKSIIDREDITYEAPDILNMGEIDSFPLYSITPTYDQNWNPFTLIPDRITEDFFGRQAEIDELTEWFDDLGSRACMLYGDGGIGKTTLAIEFIRRVIEGRIKTTWKPELITFFTAKQTRWGLQGLEYIRLRTVGMTELAVEIVRGFYPKDVDRNWFTCQQNEVIEKLSAYLNDNGINRQSHLIILDNTETMIRSEEDAKSLAKNIKELSRKVGRVLITSRRREPVEANQIEILPLEVEESIRFLRRRAELLDRKQIIQAGIPKLKQLANKLGNKPLVLEVFVQALGELGISLERAYDRVIQMHHQDLGEFLFADAWRRMPDNIKHLLLLMTKLGDMHDEFRLKLCCLQVDLSIIEADEALGESRGIATVSRVNNHVQIMFSDEFMRYSEGKVITINGINYPTQQSIDTVARRYNEFLKASTAHVYDRVSKAYRHTLARAAYQAYQEERLDDCEVFYEAAVVEDPENGWLYDRYAYFLFILGRLSDAYDKSKMATKLLPNDPETWFTRGVIEARLNTVPCNVAIESLDKACSLGKEEHLCLLQKAYAYFYQLPPNRAMARAVLDESERKAPSNHPKFYKHQEEINTLRTRMDRSY